MFMTATAIFRRIGQIAIHVQNLDRAVAFYRDTLGIPFLFHAGSLAFFRCGDVRLMLSLPEGAGDEQRSSVLYYQVDDIYQAHETLQQRGVQFVDTPHLIAKMGDHDLWMVFFNDSEGNLVGIMDERAPA
jgi:methylmalonyl-CoA/ethylmalonyl-CoA epimerase